MPTHNGVTLGPGSPLLTVAGAKRKLQLAEFDIQAAAMEALVGPARKGEPRRLGDGMTGRYPELMLLYHIPNGGARYKATAGKMKASGVLPAVPDLHLPVMRGPFASLYVEVKRPGEKPTQEQREFHEMLRAENHCVVVCWTTQQIIDVVVGYLALEPGEPFSEVHRYPRRTQDRWYERLQPVAP